MKKYKFDYIKESVEKWAPDVPRTLETIEFLPFGILLFPPYMDPYGEIIEDLNDWYKQRHEYCVKLADEYKMKTEEETFVVPKWVLEDIENTLRIQNNINSEKKTGETCQDRNVRQSLICVRKILSGEELTGGERFESLK